MQKPTIWILNGIMNAGGTESLIMELLRNKPSDADVRMIIHSGNGDFSGAFDDEIRALGIPMYYLPSVGSVGERKYSVAFGKLVSEIGKPDVIHSNMNAVGGVIAKVAKKYRIPVRIVHCHADIRYRGSKLSILKNEIALFLMKIFVNRYATDFWACSAPAAKRLFYKNKKYVVIPNVIDAEKYLPSDEKRELERAALEITTDMVAVGSVGRIAPIKNYELVLDALSILKNEGVNAHFYCYGRADNAQYFASLNEKAKLLGITDRVHFLGNSSEIFNKLNAFDVFCMTSITEGLGISALEAQANGCPCVLSTGVPLETDVGLGIVDRVETKDAKALAEAIKSAKRSKISDSVILEKFREAGYDSKAKCKDIYAMYERKADK